MASPLEPRSPSPYPGAPTQCLTRSLRIPLQYRPTDSSHLSFPVLSSGSAALPHPVPFLDFPISKSAEKSGLSEDHLVCLCACARAYVCMCACAYVCMCARAYVCMCARVHVVRTCACTCVCVFPILWDPSAVQHSAQYLKTAISYILTSFLVIYGRRASPVLVLHRDWRQSKNVCLSL